MDSLPPVAATLSGAVRPDPARVTMYSTAWCGDCRLAKHVLASEEVDFVEIDLDRHPEAAALVVEINGGFRSVPTIVFPDGKVVVEPSRQRLLSELSARSLGRAS